jgi:putative transposase
MPRKLLIRNNRLPYHVTARVNNREKFKLPLYQVWKVFTDLLFATCVIHRIQVHAFVLMPNHFHLLLTVSQHDLGLVMREFMRSVTKTLNAKSGRTGRVFGAKYHWTLVDSPLYFAQVYKYIYRNPVKAQICKKAETYRFSTLAGTLGFQPLRVPLYYPFMETKYRCLPNDFEAHVEWLNTPFQKEQDEAITAALKKTLFAPPKAGWKRTIQDAFSDSPVG